MDMRVVRTDIRRAGIAAVLLVWPLTALTFDGASKPAADPVVATAAPAAWPAAAAQRPASTGRIEGRVTLGPRLTSRRMRFQAYPDAQAAIARRDETEGESRSSEFANVVVYLEPAEGLEGRGMAPTTDPTIRQEGLAFVPHVLPVLKGTTVQFPNSDPVFHNVFSLSRAASFDLGRYPRGLSKSVRFDAPGVVKVFCHIHSDMSAVVLVLDNPFFAVPDASGTVRIEGVPPGEYRAVAWHERARPVTRLVRISPGAATPAEFPIPLEDPVE